MEINFTLIVQIVHFYIAYRILKQYLFSPLVLQIQQEDREQQQLTQAIESRRVLVVQRERTMTEEWDEQRTYFALASPRLEDIQVKIAREAMPELPTYRMDESEKNRIEHQVKEQLLKKVEHVH
jgi:hypothetical protein